MLAPRARMQKRTESSHRELILGIVRRSDRHPTADDVFMSARANVPSISLTTVYRNLRRLVRDGQLRERMFGGVSRFDAHLEEHGHLVCLECGAIGDLAADGQALAQSLKPAAPSWQVEHVDVELRGRCPTCVRKAERGAYTRAAPRALITSHKSRAPSRQVRRETPRRPARSPPSDSAV
ncbi:MAG: hypothetical protein DMD69_13430 [Gemmatimonadetes bacterium]|nr:MAG: hypothetical protein DMD69_13430 [Gemmatimonadota bacterium]PYP26325.1 MAG: hypothetical protein DMD55_10825 [Gemmatimonadota bacterium]